MATPSGPAIPNMATAPISTRFLFPWRGPKKFQPALRSVSPSPQTNIPPKFPATLLGRVLSRFDRLGPCRHFGSVETSGETRLFFRRSRCKSGSVHSRTRSETQAGASWPAAELFCLSLCGNRRKRISKCLDRILVRGYRLRAQASQRCAVEEFMVCAGHGVCGTWSGVRILIRI